MDADLTRWKGDRLLRLTILFVGAHSCVLGLAMLFASRFMLELLGIAGDVPTFFPSQSGIFMLILGVFYLAALRQPEYVWTIIVSKSLAVAFLFVHAAFLSAPAIMRVAGAFDAAMLITVSLLLARHRRQQT